MGDLTFFNPLINTLCEISVQRRNGEAKGLHVSTPVPGKHRAQGTYLTQSVSKVVLPKSIPTQIRQLVFNVSDSKE